MKIINVKIFLGTKKVLESKFMEVLKTAFPTSTASPARLLRWISWRSWCSLLRLRSWLASRVLLENRLAMHIFLRSLQRGETGKKVMLWLWWLWTCTACGMTRFDDKEWSWVRSTSLAMSAEETTMVVTWPNLRVMIGPWVSASLARDWWGFLPSARRFPIVGKEG